MGTARDRSRSPSRSRSPTRKRSREERSHRHGRSHRSRSPPGRSPEHSGRARRRSPSPPRRSSRRSASPPRRGRHDSPRGPLPGRSPSGDRPKRQGGLQGERQQEPAQEQRSSRHAGRDDGEDRGEGGSRKQQQQQQRSSSAIDKEQQGQGGGKQLQLSSDMQLPPPPSTGGEAELPGPPPVDKAAPNLGLSGKLAQESNTVNGVVLKFQPPAEARVASKRWKLYVFKSGQLTDQVLMLHKMPYYLFGRDHKVADYPIDHPSCSKQHAVICHRLTEKTDASGVCRAEVRPYLMCLGAVNGTFLNEERLEPQRFYELLEKDMVKFGLSSREYVLLHEDLVK